MLLYPLQLLGKCRTSKKRWWGENPNPKSRKKKRNLRREIGWAERVRKREWMGKKVVYFGGSKIQRGSMQSIYVCAALPYFRRELMPLNRSLRARDDRSNKPPTNSAFAHFSTIFSQGEKKKTCGPTQTWFSQLKFEFWILKEKIVVISQEKKNQISLELGRIM